MIPLFCTAFLCGCAFWQMLDRLPHPSLKRAKRIISVTLLYGALFNAFCYAAQEIGK